MEREQLLHWFLLPRFIWFEGSHLIQRCVEAGASCRLQPALHLARAAATPDGQETTALKVASGFSLDLEPMSHLSNSGLLKCLCERHLHIA